MYQNGISLQFIKWLTEHSCSSVKVNSLLNLQTQLVSAFVAVA